MNKIINDYLYETFYTKQKAAPATTEYSIGITNVAGRNSSYSNGKFIPHNESDAILKEALDSLDQGKTIEAENKLKDSVKIGIDELTKRFKNMGLESKANPGLGLFENTVESSIDTTVTVPEDKKELLHYEMAQIADGPFEQKSVITYKKSNETRWGVVDMKKGISIEPSWRIHLNKKFSLNDMAKFNKKMAKYNIYSGASIKNNGTVIDILNLSLYNKNYEEFNSNVKKLTEDKYIRAISKGIEQSNQEVRHYGIDLEKGLTTYQTVRNDYEAKNSGLISGIKAFTSNLLETITPKLSAGYLPVVSPIKVRND